MDWKSRICLQTLWDKDWMNSSFAFDQWSVSYLSAKQYRAKIWCQADKMSSIGCFCNRSFLDLFAEWWLYPNELDDVFLGDLKKLAGIFSVTSEQWLACAFVAEQATVTAHVLQDRNIDISFELSLSYNDQMVIEEIIVASTLPVEVVANKPPTAKCYDSISCYQCSRLAHLFKGLFGSMRRDIPVIQNSAMLLMP